MNNLKIKKGDTVKVIAGSDKGKTGVVLKAEPADKKLIVDGINVVSKHKKARSAQDTAGIIKQNAAIDVSDVAIVCPACGEATKVVYVESEVNGKTVKVRTCKKCGASLEAKKAAKKTATKKAAPRKKKAETAETAPATETAAE